MLALSVFWKTLPIVVAVLGVCWWALRRYKLPFVPRIFWITLGIVAGLVAIVWTLVLKFTEYELMDADYGGTVISSIIFSYLVHLWVMPIDDAMLDDGPSFDEPRAEASKEPAAESVPTNTR